MPIVGRLRDQVIIGRARHITVASARLPRLIHPPDELGVAACVHSKPARYLPSSQHPLKGPRERHALRVPDRSVTKIQVVR